MSAFRPLRVAVLGAGLMGRRHGHAYRGIPGVELVGFVDRDPAAAGRIAAEFAVPCHAEWQPLLDGEPPDAISICLPDNLHRDASLAALSRGVAVLLEKPMATSVAEAEEIAAAGRERLLLVGHNLRFDARYQQARRQFAAGRIGGLVHMTARRNSAIGASARYAASTGLVWHVGVHDIDLVQWIAGRPIREVTARGVSRRLASEGHYDSVLVLALLDDGTPVTMEMCWVLPGHFGSGLDSALQIMGTEGRITVHGFDQGLEIADGATVQHPDTMRWAELDDGSAGGVLAEEIRHFVRCVREGAAPAVALDDALSAVRVAAAIQRSLAGGATVAVT
jgi:UDP-N-acetylglucosamine 3-dehydrogenase